MLHQTHYSGLVFLDYQLFRSIWYFLRNRRFNNNEGVKASKKAFFATKPKVCCQRGIKELVESLEYCWMCEDNISSWKRYSSNSEVIVLEIWGMWSTAPLTSIKVKSMTQIDLFKNFSDLIGLSATKRTLKKQSCKRSKYEFSMNAIP